MKVTGVILAGGQATRMGGGDKGALRIGNRKMFDLVIERLAPQVDDLILNANGDSSRFAHFNLPVVPDSIVGFPGPLAGVLAGMDYAAADGADYILTAAADTPFFPTDLRQKLEPVASPIALAATQEGDRIYRQPTFGFWPVDLRDDLRQALHDGLRKVVMWTDRHGCETALFPEAAFFNINTPDDLIAAQNKGAKL